MPAHKKIDDILGTSRALFLRHGIRRVSVEEICATARVSKRTFYKYFRNKDDLAVHVVSNLFEESRSRLEAVLSSDRPLERKVEEIIAVKSKTASETSLGFLHELVTADSEPARFLRQKQHEWDERVRRFYGAAQERGEIRADLDIDLLMALLIKIRDIVEDPDLLKVQPDFGRLVEAVMKVLFYGLLPRPLNPDRVCPDNTGEGQ